MGKGERKKIQKQQSKLEQDKAFGADDSDLPKVVDSCDGQRRKEENFEAAVETVEQDKAFGADDSNDLPKVVDSCDGHRTKEENLI